MITPPPKHLVENEPEYVPMWYAAAAQIFRCCGLRDVPRRGAIVLVYVEPAEDGTERSNDG